MRRFVEIFGALILAAIFIATLAGAKQLEQVKSGTTADFTATFPYVTLGIGSILLIILGWLITRYDSQREKKMDSLVLSISETAAKLDITITKLSDRDRDIERSIAKNAEAISSIQATCAARGSMCKVVQGEHYTCPERRTGEPRRSTNGYQPARQERREDGQSDDKDSE